MAAEVPDVPEVPEDVPEVPPEVVEDVPEEVPEQPKRGRGRPRKDPSAPPRPKKQAVVPGPRETAREVREEPRSEVDNILYLFKQREIEEQRRKSEQYRVMLGL
jgi:hypothetical protein